MSLGAIITFAALDAGLLLSRNGDQIHVESPLGYPLPDGLRRQLLEHKRQVLAYLDFCERADGMLLAVSERIATCQPAGCPLDGEVWRAAAERLAEAHGSEHLPSFCEALRAYEGFAREQFSHYAAQRREER